MPRHRASVSPTFHRPGGTVFAVECQLEASFAAEALHCPEPQSTGRTLWTEREATPGRCGGFNVKDTTRPLAGDRCAAGDRRVTDCDHWPFRFAAGKRNYRRNTNMLTGICLEFD